MNIILFGAPGSGKGTQSSLLVQDLGMYQISTGDLFRAAIKNKTELGQKAQSYMDRGDLVPDSVVVGMVDEVLGQVGQKSFILDGFPRTAPQAQALDEMLTARGLNVGRAVFLEVPRNHLVSRLSGRRVCKSCSAVYHINTKPSKAEGVCDKCGGEVVQRSDDKEDVIINRLKAYEDSTAPLKEYFKAQGKFVELNGDQAPEKVFGLIREVLGQK